MKNRIKLIVFLWFCLLCGMTYGQTGTLYRVPVSGTDNIVRYEPTSRNHIVYSKSLLGDNVFSLTDMNTLASVTVWNGLDVKDFEIIDEMVFFCGDNTSGSGFLGWFDINDLFYSGGTASIDQTLSTLGLLTLENIVVYHDMTGNIHIAGYGLHASVGSLNHYRAFEAVGTPATGMQYRTLDLVSWGAFGDVSDVVVTDNFVVYLSSGRNQACLPHEGIGITLQPFPKYDMFGNPPFYHHYFQLSSMSPIYAYGYVLSINNDPYNNPINGRVYPKMVHSVGDEVAICTYRKDLRDTGWVPPTPPDSCGDTLPEIATYITNRKFDLSALVTNTNNYILMTSNVIAKLYNGDLYTIDGFEYEPQTRRYIVLHRHESSVGVVEHAVTTFNLGPPVSVESSYQTAFNTSSIWTPTSMCLDGAVHYTVMGYDDMSKEYMFWRNSIAAVDGECDKIVPHIVKTLPLELEKYYVNESKPTVWIPIHFVLMDIREEYSFPCDMICN